MKRFLNRLRSLEFQLAVEKFIFEQLWQHLLVIAFVVFCGWLFDRYVVAVMFCIAHVIIRQNFDKQYHCGKTCFCLCTTLTIAFFGIMNCFPIGISLLSVVPMCFLISWVGYIVQDRIDLMAYNKHKMLYEMTEDELRRYGAEKGLSELQQDILVHRVIESLSIAEICRYRNYGRTTIKYHIAQIKNKLGVDKV